MSLMYLLPHFMRDRLYSYPFPSSDPKPPSKIVSGRLSTH